MTVVLCRRLIDNLTDELSWEVSCSARPGSRGVRPIINHCGLGRLAPAAACRIRSRIRTHTPIRSLSTISWFLCACRLHRVRRSSMSMAGPRVSSTDYDDGAFQKWRLVPGPHEIVIYHPGHHTFRRNVDFNPGSAHTIRRTLDALEPGEAPDERPIQRPLPPGAAPLPQTRAPRPASR